MRVLKVLLLVLIDAVASLSVYFGVLSAHPDLAGVSEKTWAPMVRASGSLVQYHIEQSMLDAYLGHGIAHQHLVVLPAHINHCRDRNCHGSEASVMATMGHALTASRNWSLFVRLDDDVAVCPRTIKDVLSALDNETNVYAGYWYRLGQRYIPDEHALIIGRRLVQRFTTASSSDPVFVSDRRRTFDLQSVYWAARWNATFFHNHYDSGFTSAVSALDVCTRYGFYHRVKKADVMAAIDYSRHANVSADALQRVRNITIDPRLYYAGIAKLHNLPAVHVD